MQSCKPAFARPRWRATVGARPQHPVPPTEGRTTMTAVPRLLDLYEIAWLTGGPARVVDTALAALAESGRVTATPTGELAATDLRRRSPVEAAVLDQLGARPRRSAATLRWRVAEDERITALGARLAAEGLVVPGRGRPFGRGRPVLTRQGRRLLRQLRQDPPVDVVAPGTSALLVALTGVRAMPDAELRARLFAPPQQARRPRWVDGGSARSHTPVLWGGGDSGGWGGFGGDCGGGGGDGGGC
ncbi:TIGR04222 domain-containing membrane protein [Geodermatophilus sp. SYSU D00815]